MDAAEIAEFGILDADGSTIPAILPGALTGAYRYHRAGLVDWRVGLVCGGVGSVAAIGGAAASDVVDARWLMVITAGILAWSGVAVIRRSQRSGATVMGEGAPGGADASPEVDPASHSAPQLSGVGALAGFVAGLLGVGGGVIMVPLFTTVLRVPARVAVASSLVAVAIFSIPAMVTHTLLDHIDWGFALPLALGTVPGAWVGSRLTIASSEQRVERLLGIFFIGVAVLFGGGELFHILR